MISNSSIIIVFIYRTVNTARLTKCLRCKTANIFAKFAPLIRQRMSAYVRWRTCSFTKAANEQNSEHIRYVRFGYSAAKFVLL